MTASPDFSRVRGIYFDLDDTLCGYWDASKAGLRRAFETAGPAGFSVDEMVRHWAAAFRDFSPQVKQSAELYEAYLKSGERTRTQQMVNTLARVGIADGETAARLSEAYMRERDAALRLFDDAIQVLDLLSARYPLGLITNGPADIQRQEVATLGIERYFAHIFIEGEMGEGKPLPSVFRRAEAAMGLAPEAMLFVGNSYHHDIEPAVAAGWQTVWTRRDSDVPPSANGDAKPEERPAGSPEPSATVGDLRSVLTLLGIS